MAVRLTGQAHTVAELFGGKIFEVPDYQRSYAWGAKQREDLWNDIREGLNDGSEHYWGTITLRATEESCYCPEQDYEFKKYEIVDGQQRITTLYLLLLALSEYKPVVRNNYLKCGDIYRLRLGGLNDAFLRDLVDGKDPSPTITTNRLLAEAYQYFRQQMAASDNIDQLSRYLQNSTFSLEFAVTDETLAAKAFESLNDRGKPLSLLDKTKSFLTFLVLRYLDKELVQQVNEVFGRTFEHFDLLRDQAGGRNAYIRGRLSEDELLRFFYHYFARDAIERFNLDHAYDYDATPDHVYTSFIKDTCFRLRHDEERLASFVGAFLLDFDRFVRAFHTVIERAETEAPMRRLMYFLQPNVLVYPLLIGLEAERLLDEAMIRELETLDVRVYKIKGTAPRADLYRWTVATVKTHPDAEQIKQNIRGFIRTFIGNERFRYEMSENLYRNPAVHYILWERERTLHGDFDGDNLDLYQKAQVDHIFPRGVTLTFPAAGFSSESEYVEENDRIGNMCLLEEELNKAARNAQPARKAPYYRRSSLPGTRNLGYRIENHGITKTDLKTRQQEIIDFAVERWPV